MSFDLGSIGTASAAQYRSLFAKIDGNGDGKVTRSEFVSGAPADVSATDAGTLFDTLDQQQAGALSESDLASAFQQLSSVAQSLLIQLQGGPQGPSSGGFGADLLAKLDTDGDGKVSRDEFVAGRPDGASEDQAGALFDQIAGNNTGALTQQQLVDGLQSQRHGHGHGHHRDPSELFSSLDSNDDGTLTRDEFVAGRPQDVSADQAGTLFDQLAGDNTDGLSEDQFASALQAHRPAGGPGKGGGGGSRPDQSDESFSPLDTNKDGVISYEEFVAGRPDGVSADQASTFFGAITGSDPTTETLAKYTQGQGTADGTTSQKDTGQLVEQLLNAFSANSGESSGGTASSGQPLDVFLHAIEAYRSAALTTAA